MKVLLPQPGAPNREFERPVDRERLTRVAAHLRGRGIQAMIADDREHARRVILEMIPAAGNVHVAASETMAELGITAEIEASGRYDAVRPRLTKMDRETQRREMRQLACAPDCILGSVHAVTDDGILLAASASGSQLGPYAQSAGKVVLAVGHQKIVRDFDEGMRRIREYCLPLEYARVQPLGYPGSAVMKLLAIYGEHQEGRITIVLIPETLGY